MLQTRPWMFAAVCLGTLGSAYAQRDQPPPPEPPMPAILRAYQPVTAERLLKPEDGNRLMIRRTYDGWGYSPLE